MVQHDYFGTAYPDPTKAAPASLTGGQAILVTRMAADPPPPDWLENTGPTIGRPGKRPRTTPSKGARPMQPPAHLREPRPPLVEEQRAIWYQRIEDATYLVQEDVLATKMVGDLDVPEPLFDSLLKEMSQRYPYTSIVGVEDTASLYNGQPGSFERLQRTIAESRLVAFVKRRRTVAEYDLLLLVHAARMYGVRIVHNVSGADPAAEFHGLLGTYFPTEEAPIVRLGTHRFTALLILRILVFLKNLTVWTMAPETLVDALSTLLRARRFNPMAIMKYVLDLTA